MNQTFNLPFQKGGTSDAINEKSNNAPNPSTIKVFMTKLKARKTAKKIVRALKEVKDFESGKKQPKSFEDFLKEL